MDQSNPDPAAAPLPPAPVDPHPVGVRRVKRRLMLALIGLYGLSIIASCVLLLRPQAPESGKKGAPGEGGLLAMGQKEFVGWVPIHGMITNSDGGRPWEKGAELWARRIKAMADAPGVKAIILDINSPGGSVGAVQELHSQILRVRKEKNIPVVALFGDVAASGGYYLGAACDRIVAHGGTITGSIGVIISHSNLEGLFQKVGYKMEPIKSGSHKDILSPGRPMTQKERDIVQSLIDDAYGQFVDAVSAGRKIDVPTVKELADGRIYSGRQALQLKLVDQLGDADDAVELAAKLAGLSGRPKVRRDIDSLKGIMDLLESRFGGWLGAGPELLGGLSRLAHSGLEYRWPGF